MAQAVDLTKNPRLKLLLYGKPGAGKTRLAGSAALDPRTAPALLLDAAGNPESLRDYDPPPDIIRVEELKDLNEPYAWLSGGQKGSARIVSQFKLNPPYQTVIVDHVTDVHRMSYKKILSPNQKPGDFTIKAEWDHHGRVLGQMLNFASLYYRLADQYGLHVIMTAHERRIIDDGVLKHIEPMIWGQSGLAIPGFALAIGRLVAGVSALREDNVAMKELGLERKTLREGANVVCFFGPTAKFHTKDQYGALGNYLINPTISRMADLIYGGRA